MMLDQRAVCRKETKLRNLIIIVLGFGQKNYLYIRVYWSGVLRGRDNEKQ